MSRLEWNTDGNKTFETGVDRGVLYLPDDNGVAWNGLVSVDEDFSGVSTETLYFEGNVYRKSQSPGSYVSTLQAYTYPDEFLPFDGTVLEESGFGWANQRVDRLFGLCYRSRVGNDLEGHSHGYKLHLLYNLTASPTDKDYKSQTLSVEPTLFSWTITGVPQDAPGYRPTAHVILDSRSLEPGRLAELEHILYGSEGVAPRLPSIIELLGGFLIITNHGDGTWTAEGPISAVENLDETTFRLTAPSVVLGDEGQYTASSS
jgi:hypothetical protein